MRHILFSLLALTLLAVGCGKIDNPNNGGGNNNNNNQPAVTPVLTLMNSAITFEAEGGTISVSFKANQAWSATSDQAWATLTPSSGSGTTGEQSLSVKADANNGDERTATVTFKMGEKTATLSVKQKKDPNYFPTTTIAQFKSKPVNETTWYKLTGEIAAIEEENYGNFFIFDGTGFVYVYGLCKTQVGKSQNDQSFPQLGLKVGDTVTMMSLRSEYNGLIEAGGTTPAYFVSKTAGTYSLGSKADVAKAGWLELPATAAGDGKTALMHRFPDKKRSYTAYWDKANLVASWVAYPLCAGNIGSGTRADKFCLNPLLPRSEQPYLPKAYQAGNGGSYDRGHQIPSADRLDYRVNIETFFTTNMTPQNNNLNAGIWGTLEGKLRSWARVSSTDTLYVVTGCTVAGSTTYVLDFDEKHVTVPTGYYKAVLRLDKDKSYSAVGFYFENQNNSATSIQPSMSMSIDALEQKVGVDFFVNLPDDVEAAVEAKNPADVAWWWNN